MAAAKPRKKAPAGKGPRTDGRGGWARPSAMAWAALAAVVAISLALVSRGAAPRGGEASAVGEYCSRCGVHVALGGTMPRANVTALLRTLNGSAEPPLPYDESRGELLAQLLGPLPQRAFAAEAFESTPVHVARDRPGFCAALLGFELLERVLDHGSSTRSPTRVPPRNHVDVSLMTRLWQNEDWWTGKYGARDAQLSVREAKAKFREGFTVLINDVDQRDARVAALSEALEALLGHVVNANVYATPEGTQGFEAHYDSMDVFVVQLEGRKDWRVYAPLVELPDDERKCKPTLRQFEALPAANVTLRPGDLLYLPRGWPHEAAVPVGAAQSLHLTLGVLTKGATWEGLVHAAIGACAGGTAAGSACPAPARAAVGGTPPAKDGGGLSWAQLLHAAVRAVAWGEHGGAERGGGGGGGARALRGALPLHDAEWALRAPSLERFEAALDLLLRSPLDLLRSAEAWSDAQRSSEGGGHDEFILRPRRAAWRAAELAPGTASALGAELHERLRTVRAHARALLAPAARAVERVHGERLRVRRAARRTSLEWHGQPQPLGNAAAGDQGS